MNRGQGIACAAMVALVAFSIIMILYLVTLQKENVLTLPLIIVFSILLFVGALTIAASVLSNFQLSNRDEALGLPSGSVRALIALSLILIFAIMVIFMSNNLNVIEKYEFVGNSTTGNFTVVFEGK